MVSMQARWARVARGTVVAAVATVIAAVSHTIAGATAPSWFGIFATFVLAASAGSVLAGRTVSWVRLTASVAIGQFIFHGVFAGVGTPQVAAHSHQFIPGAPVHDHGMVWAHLVAGAVTVLMLRFGEVAFWGLADALRFVVRDSLVAAPPVASQPIGGGESPVLAPLGVPRPAPLRGPPVLFAQPL